MAAKKASDARVAARILEWLAAHPGWHPTSDVRVGAKVRMAAAIQVLQDVALAAAVDHRPGDHGAIEWSDKQVFDAIRELMAPPVKPYPRIGFGRG